jgi:hypothetical protein
MLLHTRSIVSASAAENYTMSSFSHLNGHVNFKPTTSDDCTPLKVHMQRDAKQSCLHETACDVEIVCEKLIIEVFRAKVHLRLAIAGF